MIEYSREEILLLVKKTNLSEDAVKRILYDVDRIEQIRTETRKYYKPE